MDPSEFSLSFRELRGVRQSGTLSKRSSSFLAGWSTRFVAIAGNFLYVYGSETVSAWAMRGAIASARAD